MQNPTKNNPTENSFNSLQNPPKKVVLYHTGALGDLLVSTAAVYESIQFFPEAEFTIIGAKLWKEILVPKVWPNIKLILEVQNKNFTQLKLWQANSSNNKWEEVHSSKLNFISFLKNYDVSIDLRTESLRFAWRALLARIPIRVGGSKSIFSKLFFTHFVQEKPKKENHERNRYLEVLSPLQNNLIQEKINYWNENGLPALTHVFFPLVHKNIVLINPTASIREKAWPSEKFRQLAIKLKEQGNEIIIIGSPKETAWLKEVSSEDFRIVRPHTIPELVNIVAQAKLLITNTSSMQFIAASTKTPTLTLMGLAEVKKWGPLGSWSHYVKGKEFRLSKSFFKPKKETSKLNEVLSYNSISVDEVLVQISRNRKISIDEQTRN